MAEHILPLLNAEQLLSVYQVDRNLKYQIERSPKLLRRLGLQPDPTGHMRFTMQCLPSWQFKTDKDCISPVDFCDYFDSFSYRKTRQIRVTIEVDAPLGQLGTRCESMLFCQPPLMDLDVFVECCERPREDFGMFSQIHEDRQLIEVISARTGSSGITLGDINRTAQSLT
jgi:hypothetical protein